MSEQDGNAQFLFNGHKALRIKYHEMDTTAINNSGTSKSTAKLLAQVRQQTRIALFNNSSDVDLSVYLVHPGAVTKATSDDSYKLFAFEVPANTPLNFDISGTIGLSFDVGTQIFISKSGGTANSGKLRLIMWG